MRRRHDARRSRIAATIAALFLVAVTYVSFVKGLPFGGEYEIKAVFSNANQLEKEDEVRLAGLRVGQVTDVRRGPDDTAVATLRIDDRRVPLHVDATASVRSRLLLEGNDRVDLSPGSPAAPELESGATLPLSQTDSGVQIDQALGVLDKPGRTALTDSLGELAMALGGDGPGAGAAALRQAFRELDGALGNIAVVSRAAQGTQTGDLRRAVASTGDFAAELALDPRALADVVTNYNRTFGALAARDTALAASVRGFDELVRTAPPDLLAIEQAMPVLAEFAEALEPTVRALPPTLRDLDDVLVELEGLSGPRELPALLSNLGPVTTHLPGMLSGLEDSFRQITPAMRCISRNVVPVLNAVAPDGANTTNRPIWQDLAHAFAGFAGIASSFDGNGATVRLGVTENEGAVEGVIPGFGKVAGLSPNITGHSPVWLGYGVEPPYRPDVECTTQDVADLSQRTAGNPPNFRRVPIAPPTKSEQRMVRQLLTPDGRRRLLRRLIEDLDLPQAGRRRARPARPAPVRRPPQTAPAPAAPTPAPSTPNRPLEDLVKRLPEVPIVTDTVTETLGTVQKLIDDLRLDRLGVRP